MIGNGWRWLAMKKDRMAESLLSSAQFGPAQRQHCEKSEGSEERSRDLANSKDDRPVFARSSVDADVRRERETETEREEKRR